MDQPFYIISNASKDIYPHNTLTDFRNRFPKTLSFNERDRWEVGIETIGLSSMFRNIHLPNKIDVPSVMVGEITIPLPKHRSYRTENPLEDDYYSLPFDFKTEDEGGFFEKIDIPDKYYEETDVYIMIRVLNLKSGKKGVLFNFDQTRGQLAICYTEPSLNGADGVWVFLHETFAKSFKFEGKFVKRLNMIQFVPKTNPTLKEVYLATLKKKAGDDLKYQDEKYARYQASIFRPYSIYVKELEKTYHERLRTIEKALEKEYEENYEDVYKRMAESWQESDPEVQNQTLTPPGNMAVYPEQEVNLVELNNKLFIQRKVIFNGETYLAYFLHKDKTREYYQWPYSDNYELKVKELPDIIKVQCDLIEPQIINNSYSQDLLVLSTDIQYTNNYFFHEIEKISFFPLLYNDVSEIRIKLVDEKNEQLQLSRGHATIVKLRFRKNTRMENNFYVRVSSKPNEIYPDNKPNKFSVQLPSTKILNSDWKVSLNSINIPNRFTTFLSSRPVECKTLVINVKKPAKKTLSLTFPSDVNFTPALLLSTINNFLINNNEGQAHIDSAGRLVIKMTNESSFALGLDVAKVLGFESGRVAKNFMFVTPYAETPNDLYFESPINVNYFRPNYFIIYTNIVQPSVIGNQYSPILKIVPILESQNSFKLHDFKVREFYSIPTTEISDLKMELRTHDGELVNFLENEHVIMNFQFTNERFPS